MKKTDWLFTLPACCYELFRCFAIYVTRPEDYIEILPVSWYAGIFALILPVVLAFFSFRKEKTPYTWLYYFVKIAQSAGIAKYIYDDLPYAVQNGTLNGWYSANRLISLVSFLVIDVILLVVLFFYQKKWKDINADNSNSER